MHQQNNNTMKRKSIMTEQDYCPKDVVIALLDKGYPCHTPYRKIGSIEIIQKISLYEAQKWIRDEHKLHITIKSISQESWEYHVTKAGSTILVTYGEDCYTYEEALLRAIIETIMQL